MFAVGALHHVQLSACRGPSASYGADPVPVHVENFEADSLIIVVLTRRKLGECSLGGRNGPTDCFPCFLDSGNFAEFNQKLTFVGLARLDLTLEQRAILYQIDVIERRKQSRLGIKKFELEPPLETVGGADFCKWKQRRGYRHDRKATLLLRSPGLPCGWSAMPRRSESFGWISRFDPASR